jgi:hypothetical protein
MGMQVSQPVKKKSLISNAENSSAVFKEELSPAKKLMLTANGGHYLSGEVAKLLNISEQRLEELRQTNKIIGLPCPDGGYVYPKWQITNRFLWGHQLLRGLDEVLAKFPSKSPWMRAGFMTSNVSVDLASPLAGLQAGKISQVVALVEDFGEHGAA